MTERRVSTEALEADIVASVIQRRVSTEALEVDFVGATVGQASETDTATAVAISGVIAIGLAREVDSAIALAVDVIERSVVIEGLKHTITSPNNWTTEYQLGADPVDGGAGYWKLEDAVQGEIDSIFVFAY